MRWVWRTVFVLCVVWLATAAVWALIDDDVSSQNPPPVGPALTTDEGGRDSIRITLLYVVPAMIVLTTLVVLVARRLRSKI
jgi:hypothetical protein